MTIKNKLIVAIGAILVTFGINTAISIYEINNVKEISQLTAEESIPFALLAANIKQETCQINQLLTDASLTQNNDSVKEAEASYNLFLNHLSKFEKMFKQENDSESLLAVNSVREKAQKLMSVGKKMVSEYKTNKSSGDSVMVELDEVTEELATLVEKIGLEQENEAILNSQLVIEKSNKTLIISLILGLIGMIIGIVIGSILTKQITTSLKHFQEGLLSFFSYINREASEVNMLKEEGKDEFAQMAKIVNANITQTSKNIEEDRKLIDESIAVLS